MKAILVLALCASVLAVDMNQIFTNHQQQAIAQARQSRWGKWMLDFAEVHLQTGGLLNQLLEAMQSVIHDLEVELDNTHKAFQKRTGEHKATVGELTQSIEDAERDLFNGNDLVDNVLIPQRTRITQALKQLKQNIDENRKTLAQETKQRAQDHADFEARAAEHSDAIEAIDECLELLSTITNPSLVQIKKVQAHIQTIHNKLKSHNKFAPLVRALLQVATEQNFADQDSLQTIVNAFNDLRVNLVNSLNQETADEADEQANFEQRVIQLNAELAEFQRQTLLRQAELTRTNEKLEETYAFIAVRKADKATFEAQLNAENDNYAQETDAYNALVTEYTKEHAAAEAAYAIVAEPTFVEYVNNLVGA